jgi:cytochrome c biogenesis protein CcdA/thiol-disulfide isomerase/thioredoxin
MVLLIGFAFLAGAGTAVSPCVLPVLPIVLSAGATGGKRRPLGIVTGLALSFTFATVALVYVIDALGLPNGLPRTVAIVVLFAFGMALLLPPLAARVEALLSRFSGRFGVAGAHGDGFRSGLLIGGSLGFVYAPCAGPILAGVITVSAAQSFTAGRLAVALAYGLGSAAILYALALGGRRLTSRLSRRAGRLQVAMGAVMVLVAVAMLANLDTRFENAIASDVPGFLVDPTKSLENSHAAQRGLVGVRGRIGGGSGQVRSAAGTAEADAGLRLPVLGAAPELVGLDKWFNTLGGQPLTLAQLRGRVVLVDFWTYSCINCIRTLPYLRAWDAQYRSKGLTIVGIHTPEFPFEHDPGNVRTAIAQDGLRYPVAQDNQYQTWNAYSNQYWPAEYLIDAQGRVRLVDFGEGNYSGKERAIRSLLVEAGAQRLGGPVGSSTRAQAPPTGEVTPETYLGSARAKRFVNGQITSGTHDYGAPKSPPTDGLAYGGKWKINSEAASGGPGASLELRFHARRVFLVLGSPRHSLQARVLLDGHPVRDVVAGSDLRGSTVTVHAQRLYELIDLRKTETHLLTLLPAVGVSGYAFTFG